MGRDLEVLTAGLGRTEFPEAIFGVAGGDREARRRGVKTAYRRLAQVAHPDHYAGGADRAMAEEAIKRLNRLYELAERKLAAGTYGTGGGAAEGAGDGLPAVIWARDRAYLVTELIGRDDLCLLYRCRGGADGAGAPAILQIVRDPADNDLVANEARALRRLASSPLYAAYRAYVPGLVDAFRYPGVADGVERRANVLTYVDGLCSLAEVAEAYPAGLDPRDVAWIARRLLVALGFLHRSGVIHGAVLPDRVLIQPEQHGLTLSGFAYAVVDAADSGERIGAIPADWADWYPKEVWTKELPTPALDLYLATACQVFLLGGDPDSGRMPEAVPRPLRAFLRGCMLPDARQRPRDAWALLRELDALLEAIWGPRRFHPFGMPAKTR
jgi:hypothetical protein